MTTITMTRPTYTEINWREGRACRKVDPELFFNDDTEQIAVAICFHCPVRELCLQWAIDHKEKHGVWGGLTELERRQATTVRVRVKCPHCSGTKIYDDERSAICLNCGLSWPV